MPSKTLKILLELEMIERPTLKLLCVLYWPTQCKGWDLVKDTNLPALPFPPN